MSALKWDEVGEHLFETGIDHGVLYPMSDSGTYPLGVAWNGLTGVTESPEGAEANDKYADNIKYLSIRSAETFKATVKAFTYPDEWAQCNGEAVVNGVTVGQQSRKSFGLVYRTIVGNDIKGNDYAYKLHLVYNGTASPSERDYQTVNDSPDAIEFSWEIDTTPVTLTTKIDGKTLKPTSILTIDSSNFTTEAAKAKLNTLEAALFGTDADPEDPQSVGTEPYLPDPDTVISMLSVG
jgi:hypothetical protein